MTCHVWQTDLNLQQKVLVCLKTLGSGSFQNCSKDFVEVSQQCVSKLLSAFTSAIVSKASRFIHMPTSADGLESLKTGFYQVAKVPGVVGCIDGTHIPIIARGSRTLGCRVGVTTGVTVVWHKGAMAKLCSGKRVSQFSVPGIPSVAVVPIISSTFC